MYGSVGCLLSIWLVGSLELVFCSECEMVRGKAGWWWQQSSFYEAREREVESKLSRYLLV